MYNRHGLVLGLALSLSFGQLTAQSTPQAIKVQGFLSDTSGGSSVPANGTFSMTFDLYDTEMTGTGSLIRSVGPLSVDVIEGLYSAQLPFVHTDFEGTDRYLEITVNGEVLSPRVRMVSAPFAYKAETLDGLEGADLEESAEIAAAEANLQAQIETINTQLGDVGNTLGEAYNEGGPGGGRTIVADSGAVHIGGSYGMIVAGNTGIGTETPNERLTVQGGISMMGADPASSGGQVFLLDEIPSYYPPSGATGFRINAAYPYGGGHSSGPRANVMTFDGDTVLGTDENGDPLGFVGIGTETPNERLTVQGGISMMGADPASSGGQVFVLDETPSFLPPSGAAGFQINAAYPHATGWHTGPLAAVLKYDGNTILGTDANGASLGNVGIGTTTPTAKLDVVGTTKTQVLEITGADLVEGFESGDEVWEPGTVMVIDSERPGHLRLSTQPYDTRVAGIVSGAGGIPHGVYMGRDSLLDGDTLLAMAGRVYAKCSTENGPIQPGDLLTTSGTPGHAMRVDDVSRATGAIVGKAMSSLEDEQGLLLVLVNLQ